MTSNDDILDALVAQEYNLHHQWFFHDICRVLKSENSDTMRGGLVQPWY